MMRMYVSANGNESGGVPSHATNICAIPNPVTLMTSDKPLNNMMIVNASWNFDVGADKIWKVKPIINYYNLANNIRMMDVLARGTWKDILSLTGGFRTNGSLIIATGLNLKSFALHKAYYNQTSGMNTLAPTQNEIAIAFSFGSGDSGKAK